MAKLIGIAVKNKKRAPMQTMESVFISMSEGVAGDYRGKPSKRQVTVMSQQAWREVNAILKSDLPWTTRRANLLIDGLDLERSVGKVIKVGDVVLRVTQETDPCKRMEEAAAGLYNVLKQHWRGGVCCRVIKEGQVTLGDKVVMDDLKSV